MHNTPNYQGYFLRGVGGNSAGLGIEQGDAIRNIEGVFTGTGEINIDSIKPTVSGPFYVAKPNGGVSVNNGLALGASPEDLLGFDASKVVPTSEENRPINKAVKYIIKAE